MRPSTTTVTTGTLGGAFRNSFSSWLRSAVKVSRFRAVGLNMASVTLIG